MNFVFTCRVQCFKNECFNLEREVSFTRYTFLCRAMLQAPYYVRPSVLLERVYVAHADFFPSDFLHTLGH